MYGGVRWEYCLEEWGAKSYFWGVLSKGVRRDIIEVSIELLFLFRLVSNQPDLSFTGYMLKP